LVFKFNSRLVKMTSKSISLK